MVDSGSGTAPGSLGATQDLELAAAGTTDMFRAASGVDGSGGPPPIGAGFP